MKNPDGQHQVQPPAAVGEPTTPSGPPADSASAPDLIQRHERRQRTVVAGTAFGAFVGVLMGAIVGAACCWLSGAFDFLEQGLLIGALAGSVAGALIGLVERKRRGDLVRPDIATLVGVLFGLLPGLVVVLQGLSGVEGKLSGYLFLGMIFAGSMAGLIIGALFDRAFDEGLKRSWKLALGFAVLGVAACVGMLWLIDRSACGPEPQEIARETRALLASRLSKDPATPDATIHQVTLFREGRTAYRGFADVTLAGQKERLLLQVLVEGDMLDVSWTKEPLPQQAR